MGTGVDAAVQAGQCVPAWSGALLPGVRARAASVGVSSKRNMQGYRAGDGSGVSGALCACAAACAVLPACAHCWHQAPALCLQRLPSTVPARRSSTCHHPIPAFPACKRCAGVAGDAAHAGRGPHRGEAALDLQPRDQRRRRQGAALLLLRVPSHRPMMSWSCLCACDAS